MVLTAGFYLLSEGAGAQQKAIDVQFPLSEGYSLQGEARLVSTGLVLLAVAGLITGAATVALSPADRFIRGVFSSCVSGILVGILAFLVDITATFASLVDKGLSGAIAGMFMASFDITPLFVLIAFILLLFAAVGGLSGRLILMATRLLRPKKV